MRVGRGVKFQPKLLGRTFTRFEERSSRIIRHPGFEASGLQSARRTYWGDLGPLWLGNVLTRASGEELVRGDGPVRGMGPKTKSRWRTLIWKGRVLTRNKRRQRSAHGHGGDGGAGAGNNGASEFGTQASIEAVGPTGDRSPLATSSSGSSLSLYPHRGYRKRSQLRFAILLKLTECHHAAS